MTHSSPSMAQIVRIRPPLRLALVYAALLAAWAGLARWVVPPLLTSDHPGPLIIALKRYLHGFATPFNDLDALGCWSELSGALIIAAILHLTILAILRRYDLGIAEGRSADDLRAARRASQVLAVLAFAFLAVAALTFPRHDYYFYLQIWYEVRQGHDPWWNVVGLHGEGPLNAYGPLFNLLAGPAWVNPLAPRLFFAYGYLLFAIASIKDAMASLRPSRLGVLGLFAWFWNPFPWIEIAIRGHFDILVGLLCLAAIHARLRDRDILSGICLALGVLLKYFPIVLLPFFVLDGDRFRLRTPFVALASIACGLALSCALWGPATLRPLTFAANRPSATMSIYWFFRSPYSPLLRMGMLPNLDYLSPVIMGLALMLAWSWSRRRRPSLEAVAAVVAATTVLLYRVGYPQYQMVPFVLVSSWVLRNWRGLRARTLLGVALAFQLAWLAVFDVCDVFYNNSVPSPLLEMVQNFSGMPTFVFGCLLLTGMVRAATPEHRDTVE
jgi:hypothetical protein